MSKTEIYNFTCKQNSKQCSWVTKMELESVMRKLIER